MWDGPLDSRDNREAAPQLALIIGAARSGTTLFRLLLNAHPGIVAPAEAGLPGVLDHLARAWATVEASTGLRRSGFDQNASLGSQGPLRFAAAATPQNSFDRLGPEAQSHVREAVTALMTAACHAADASVYCDKSLDSAFFAPIVEKAFPGTRYLILVRHVLDTVASGLEASPWGFSSYGYTSYVQANPGNFVAALSMYWLDHVLAALQFREEHPHRCTVIRYEDLVADPHKIVAEVLRFLGVSDDTEFLDGALLDDRGNVATGPGDYKIRYTSSVSGASVGRGRRVPVEMIPSGMLAEINGILEKVGYDALTPAWNTEAAGGECEDTQASGIALEALLQNLDFSSSALGIRRVPSFAVVAEDHESLRWVIHPAQRSCTRGDGEVEEVVVGRAHDLLKLFSHNENPGVLLRSGRIRHMTAHEGVTPDQLAESMRLMLTLSESALPALRSVAVA